MSRTSSVRRWCLVGVGAAVAGAGWLAVRSLRVSATTPLEYALHCGDLPSANQAQWTERARSRDLQEIYALPAKLKAEGRMRLEDRCTVRAARVASATTRTF